MRLLVTTAHPSLVEHRDPRTGALHPNLGRLVQPRHYSSVERTAAAGIPCIAFGERLWPPRDVMRAMDGVAPDDEQSEIPLVEGHIDTVLRVLDRMHGDRAAWARANELLHREKPDEPAGANDPCWCGSGKKFKRCHRAPPR